MSISCGCMDMWLVFLTLILLTRFSQRGSLVSGGGHLADHNLKEIGMGQASAWGMARLRSLEYRWKVDAATRCSGACSHT